MSKNIALALVVAVLAVGIVIAIFAARQPTPGGEAFRETGNLIRNNPGYAPDVWYLVYEAPGEPALNVQLAFTEESMCVTDDTSVVCNTETLAQGMRATVEGTRSGNTVSVARLTSADAPDEHEMIRVSSPLPEETITSPVTITGEARGNWYFEASFPVKILDGNGAELGMGIAQTHSDWMTTEFVPFTASITFSTPSTDTGTLVLMKDNPSGLPENDDEFRVPVRFNRDVQAVKLYYYNAENDEDEAGNILCSAQGLVGVNRSIPVTTTPIQDTVRLLLAGQLTPAEKATGISTEFPLAGVELVGANLEEGTLTLEFRDPQNKTTGGSCRVGVLWAQIEATAKQFDGVETVRFVPEELFQP